MCVLRLVGVYGCECVAGCLGGVVGEEGITGLRMVEGEGQSCSMFGSDVLSISDEECSACDTKGPGRDCAIIRVM